MTLYKNNTLPFTSMARYKHLGMCNYNTITINVKKKCPQPVVHWQKKCTVEMLNENMHAVRTLQCK
jgi:hypothetical protein